MSERYHPRPRVESLPESMARIAAVIQHPDTLARIQARIANGESTSYQIEIHQSTKNGLCVELNYSAGRKGQVLFFGKLMEEQPADATR